MTIGSSSRPSSCAASWTAALQRLVRWHSAQREFEPALGYARRRLALDPLDEQAHRHLMRLYAWSGRRSAALRQYEECVAILEDQLGVPPQEATTELYQAIQEGRAPPLPDEQMGAGDLLLADPESDCRTPILPRGRGPVEGPSLSPASTSWPNWTRTSRRR